MNKYDIIFVNFPHQENIGQSDRHPALVLDGNRVAHLAAQITSQRRYANRPDCYELQDWEVEGLDKPSVVKLSHQESFTRDSIIAVFGHLTERDIQGIEAILNVNESLNEVVKTTDNTFDLDADDITSKPPLVSDTAYKLFNMFKEKGIIQ